MSQSAAELHHVHNCMAQGVDDAVQAQKSIMCLWKHWVGSVLHRGRDPALPLLHLSGSLHPRHKSQVHAHQLPLRILSGDVTHTTVNYFSCRKLGSAMSEMYMELDQGTFACNIA